MGSLGVEVGGVDLREELATDTVSAIAQAWDKYGVLLFRDQVLGVDDQRRFTQHFGELQITRNGQNAGSNLMYIGNVTVDGMEGEVPSGELIFHQDGCYAERPAKQTLLFGLEIPSAGGNTKFCSTARAYAALPTALRERIFDYDVHFVHDRWADQSDVHTGPQYTHPLVIAHPSTGEPLLFCNGLMAEAIVGLPRAESDELISQLRAEIERPEAVYEHVWRVGDLLAWDPLESTCRHASLSIL